MSTISDIVVVTISRETTAVSQPSFGIPGIIAEFATSKTTVVFDRYKYYASIAEMVTDGWVSTDEVYLAANAIFAQDPSVEKLLVGRKDIDDTAWADALSAIQIAQSEWYTFSIIPAETSTVLFDADFVTSNSITFTINDAGVTAVPFNVDQDDTMDDIKTQIEADIAGSSVTLDDESGDNRTLTVSVFGEPAVVTAVITGGASTAGDTVTTDVQVAMKSAMAWSESNKKIFAFSTSDVNAYDGTAESDLGYFASNSAYDRTLPVFYLDNEDSYIEEAMVGEALPYDAGSQTWAFKTLAGIPAYSLTSTQRAALLAKSYNIYTTKGGVNVTQYGTVASGEYIDVIRGLDWLESRLEVEVFTKLVNLRKIPYDNSGITLIQSTVEKVLQEAARAGVLQGDSIVVTAPKYADIPTADILARNLPEISFTALLQGAIHKVEVNGTVTV